MQDRVIPVARTWDLVRTIPNSDAHLFSNCGHWSQVEKADEFNGVLAGWFAARGLGA